jgi:hypothetical protein
MIFRSKPPIRRSHRGVEVHLSPEEREVLRALVAEHREQLTRGSDDPDLRRLFPTAYNDDPERDAEYQILGRAELMDSRLTAVAKMEATVGDELLDDEQYASWLSTVNQIRLVLGTRLGISEDDDAELDPDDPSVRERVLYHYLTMLMSMLVEAAD